MTPVTAECNVSWTVVANLYVTRKEATVRWRVLSNAIVVQPLRVPTMSELYAFIGKPIGSLPAGLFSNYLEQAMFLVAFRACITETPQDPMLAKLVQYAIMDLAYVLYLDSQYAEVKANPFSSETIGSYSYSKRDTRGAAQKALTSPETGSPWFDFLLRNFGCPGTGVGSGSTHVFENQGVYVNAAGDRWVLGPADIEVYEEFDPGFSSYHIDGW